MKELRMGIFFIFQLAKHAMNEGDKALRRYMEVEAERKRLKERQ
jgi:hypothetical protein